MIESSKLFRWLVRPWKGRKTLRCTGSICERCTGATFRVRKRAYSAYSARFSILFLVFVTSWLQRPAKPLVWRILPEKSQELHYGGFVAPCLHSIFLPWRSQDSASGSVHSIGHHMFLLQLWPDCAVRY